LTIDNCFSLFVGHSVSVCHSRAGGQPFLVDCHSRAGGNLKNNETPHPEKIFSLIFNHLTFFAKNFSKNSLSIQKKIVPLQIR
jgi:hypothetical protein